MKDNRFIRVDHLVRGAGVTTESMSASDLQALVRSVRASRAGVEVRCPKPKYRWKPGLPGPCGRKLGELHPFGSYGALLEVLAPLEQVLPASTVPPFPIRYRLLAEPSSGRFIENGPVVPGESPRAISVNDWSGGSSSGGSQFLVKPGYGPYVSLDCPRCGVTSDLPKLTGRRVMR